VKARFQRNLKVPPVPAFAALADLVGAIAEGRGAWRGFALHVNLGDLGLPDVGYLAVPIRLTAGKPQTTTRSIDIRFAAAKHPSAFPKFGGAAGIEATGPTGTIFWLAGEYNVPMSLFGKLFDRTIASGVAARTLENLVDDLAAAIVASVEKREAEFMRYRLYER
jgi:hypothetical protein